MSKTASLFRRAAQKINEEGYDLELGKTPVVIKNPKPVGKYLIVIQLSNPTVTKGGLHLPQNADSLAVNMTVGPIWAVGPEVAGYHKGDYVMWHPMAGTLMPVPLWEGIDPELGAAPPWLIIHEDDIRAVSAAESVPLQPIGEEKPEPEVQEIVT